MSISETADAGDSKQTHSKQPILVFFGALALLMAISLLLQVISMPNDKVRMLVQGLVVAVFITVPILALYKVASYRWRPGLALLFVLGGVLAQVGFRLAADAAGTGMGGAALMALSQAGLVTWAAGLGALLATLLKEKNLLLPVSLFLAAFDLFLVLTPVGFVSRVLKSNPAAFQNLAMITPRVQAEAGAPTGIPAFAYVGPADLLFLAAFFVAMFRFGMRTKETLLWMIPVLFLYLVLVLVGMQALPALVPIGLTVLIVNFPEFRLSKQEWASTLFVVAIGAALVIWGSMQPEPQAVPSPPDAGQGAPESAETPSQGVPGSPP